MNPHQNETNCQLYFLIEWLNNSTLQIISHFYFWKCRNIAKSFSPFRTEYESFSNSASLIIVHPHDDADGGDDKSNRWWRGPAQGDISDQPRDSRRLTVRLPGPTRGPRRLQDSKHLNGKVLDLDFLVWLSDFYELSGPIFGPRIQCLTNSYGFNLTSTAIQYLFHFFCHIDHNDNDNSITGNLSWKSVHMAKEAP